MSIRIGIGSGLGAGLSLAQYWRWVELCETGGIDSIWHSDQLLGPTLEPMAMLAALAAATRRLRFGANAVVVSFRDPLVLAKQLATIDFLSGGGRLLPVFGIGNAGDAVWAATGRTTQARGKRANEAITLVRRLLSEERVSFAGEYFQYRDAHVSPRPARPIPLWIGGDSPAAAARAAALGDGWLGGTISPERAGETIAQIKAALRETGRTIEDDHYGVVVPFRFGAAEDSAVQTYAARLRARRRDDQEVPPLPAIGGAGEIIAAFQLHVAAGVCKFVAIPIAEDGEDMLAQTQSLANEILPAVESARA